VYACLVGNPVDGNFHARRPSRIVVVIENDGSARTDQRLVHTVIAHHAVLRVVAIDEKHIYLIAAQRSPHVGHRPLRRLAELVHCHVVRIEAAYVLCEHRGHVPAIHLAVEAYANTQVQTGIREASAMLAPQNDPISAYTHDWLREHISASNGRIMCTWLWNDAPTMRFRTMCMNEVREAL